MANSNENQAEPVGFFSLNAEYLVAPQSTPGQLMNDVGCLMGSAIDVLTEAAEELGGKGFAVLYLMQQARASHIAAQSILHNAGSIQD